MGVLDSNNTLQNQSIDNSPTALYNSIQSPSSSSSSTTATATATSASVSTTEQTANPITPPNSSLNPHFNSISTKSSINTNTNTTASPILHTPRAKKVLDIVNPHTGMRVGSPKLIMDYDDFSHDNNPFAGSNHYYSNGINDMIISSNNNDDDNNNNDDNADNDNDNLIETSSILNDDIDNNTSYDFANNTTTSLPISISEQPTLYLPINDNNNKNNEINQLLNSPYIIKSFEIGKDFKGSKTVFYKIENIINKTFTLRRYNDFKSLRNYLCKFYPYLFIPPIPEKHSISRFLKNPFNYKNDLSIIELRIRLLNYFLFKINLNNKLSNSQIMIKFLDPLINNWLNCLKFPPFTNLSSNSILLVSTKNPTKPSPYFSFLPIPPINLIKNFNTDLNNKIFKNLEIKLKFLLKISYNLEFKSKNLIKFLQSLRINMVEFGGFLNIFSIIENQNFKIEKFGNKIDLNFLNIEILINNLIIKIKEPLIILKNSIIYLLQLLHFRKLKELQLIYFQNIILKKQLKLKSLILILNPNLNSNLKSNKLLLPILNSNSNSNSPSLNIVIQNINSSTSSSSSIKNDNNPKISNETKKLYIDEIKILNNELNQNLLPCFKNLSDDVNFLSTQVEKNVNLELENLFNLIIKIIYDWKSNVWGEYLTNCLKLWEK
ncbi:hypothetical protein C6P42_000631 [Pichia californica]|nr:hypothetical protein C6P42_000631 [[Candida] californica]